MVYSRIPEVIVQLKCAPRGLDREVGKCVAQVDHAFRDSVVSKRNSRDLSQDQEPGPRPVYIRAAVRRSNNHASEMLRTKELKKTPSLMIR